MSIISEVFEASDKIKNGRTEFTILTHTLSELGELAEEILIAKGLSYKKEGKDKVKGEIVDAILCLLDLLHVHDLTVTEEEIMEIVKLKLIKWKSTAYIDALVVK